MTRIAVPVAGATLSAQVDGREFERLLRRCKEERTTVTGILILMHVKGVPGAKSPRS